jgi:CPA1 family monovalent cation:H+ antiporter
MILNPLDQIALLLALAAAFAYFNHYVLRLPRNVGLLALALAAAVVLRLVALAFPELMLDKLLGKALARIDFAPLLLNLLLAFLLFAGAVEVDLGALLDRKWTILSLATVSVFLSTMLVGFGLWAIFAALGIAVPIFYCLAFGALISPTDPVTVLDVLRRAPLPDRLRAIIAGEAMFNDGIGIVLYSLLLQAAVSGGTMPGPLVWVLEFVREAGGGALLGLATGLFAFIALRGIDEYSIELMISLALVAGTYGIADTIGVSGPVAVVIAGLIIGSIGKRYAVSARTHDYLSKFWGLVDALLNALLYFLVGLQFAIVALDWQLAEAAGAAIVLSLVARAVSVAIPGVALNLHSEHKLRAIAVMSWSGLRGGISLALALSIPGQDFRVPLIAVTYAVVIFTMLVQGLSLGWVCRRLYPQGAARDPAQPT